MELNFIGVKIKSCVMFVLCNERKGTRDNI